MFFFLFHCLPAMFPSIPLTHVASHIVEANCQHCSLTVVASLGHCGKSQHAKCHTVHSAMASTKYVWECHVLYLKIQGACSFGHMHGLVNRVFAMLRVFCFGLLCMNIVQILMSTSCRQLHLVSMLHLICTLLCFTLTR